MEPFDRGPILSLFSTFIGRLLFEISPPLFILGWLIVECFSWFRHFRAAATISAWMRAQAAAHRRSLGIRPRSTPLPVRLITLPARFMALSFVMTSMWRVALVLGASGGAFGVNLVPVWHGGYQYHPSDRSRRLRKPPDPFVLSKADPHCDGKDGVFVGNSEVRSTADDVAEFEAVPQWEMDIPDIIDKHGHLNTEPFCPINERPTAWNLLNDTELYCHPVGHVVPEGDSTEVLLREGDDDSNIVGDNLKAVAPYSAKLPPTVSAHPALHQVHIAGTSTMADLFSVIWDTGATVAVTFDRDDFESYTPTDPTQGDKVLTGFAEGSSIAGSGTLAWTVSLPNGKGFTFRMPGVHVPSSNVRLFSPQSYSHLVKTQRGVEPCFSGDSSLIHFDLLDGNIIDIPYSPENNLPTMEMFRKQTVAFNAQKLQNCVTATENQNLTAGQKCLLRYHFRFVHRSLKHVQNLLKTGALGNSAEIKAAARCELPKCAACMYGKAKRKSTGAKLTVDSKIKVLSKDILIPGQKVSMDHFSVSTKGRLYSGFGGTKDDEKYKGGVIFVDHASGFVYVVHVLNFTAGEALRAKLEFESVMANHGITVVQYHTDNGTFTAQEFSKQIDSNYQMMTLSGPGAHHQNAVAERAIGTIISLARTTMLHAKLRWPKAISSDLWPQAVDYAVQNYNIGPRENNTSPADMMYRTTTDRKVFADMHVWGSPVYILNPKMQDGHKIPKFDPRSRRGVFLGLSKRHASNVPVVLNLETNRISAQFHVVVDDWFATVSNVVGEDDFVDPESWADIFASSRFQVFFDEDDPVDLDDEWLSQNELQSRIEERSRKIRSVQDKASPPVEFDKVHQRLRSDAEPTNKSNEEPTFQRELAQKTDTTTPVKLLDSSAKPVEPIPVPKAVVDTKPPQSSPRKKAPVAPAEPRRSERNRRAPKRFNEFITNVASIVLAPIPRETYSFLASIHSGLVACYDSETGEFDFRDPVAFAAMQRALKKPKKGSDPDYPMYHQAMSSPEYRYWQDAMLKEIRTLEKMGTWKTILRSSVPANKRVIKSTWAFRLKRSPDGTPTKYKARFCVRGDMEVKGVDYFESYSPVVQWSTVRLLLIMSIVHGMHTRQVDYVNAFAQAPLPQNEECYIEMPQGFHDDGDDTVLMLKKTLYGKSDSPLRFFNLLKDTLEKHGFKQLVDIDACLFVHKKIICLTYVDDCLWFSLDEKCMDDIIDDIDKVLTLTVESKDVSAFLGIQFTRRGATIELTQTGLIKRVIEAADMIDCNTCDTPAEHKPLGKDPSGAAFSESWHYASVVGMLLYLASNSRPDIAFAVHQCARFTHAPKQSHAKAIKRIIRYLKGTSDRGLIMRPTKELKIDCFVDADFAGLWGVEDPDDPISVKSRTGYILTLGNCPLLWVSKLQSEISLSTMESEYVALSTAMRDVLPMRRLVIAVAKAITGEDQVESIAHSDVFEDNNGALTLATIPRMTPRSKHYATKYHFFRQHVQNGDLKIHKIDTKEQLADIMTKGLPKETFTYLRDKLMGWSDYSPSSSERECHGYTGIRQTTRDSDQDSSSNANSEDKESSYGHSTNAHDHNKTTQDQKGAKGSHLMQYKSVRAADASSLVQDNIQPSSLASDILGESANQQDLT